MSAALKPLSDVLDPALLALAVDRTGVAVVVTDADGRPCWSNAAFARLAGRGATDLPPEVPAGLQPDGDADAVRRVRAAIAGGRGCREQVRNRRHDGTHYWVDIDVQPLHGRDGALLGFVAVHADVTAQRGTLDSLREYGDRLDGIARNVPGLLYECRLEADQSARYTFATPAIESIFGLTFDEVSRNAWRIYERVHPDDLPALRTSIQASIRDLMPWRHEYRLIDPDGTVRWLEANGTPQRQPDGAILWHGYVQEVTARKLHERQIEFLAHHDSLTGLPNRHALKSLLEPALADDAPFALLLVDLDGFKQINDAHGHDAGDRVLVAAAKRIARALGDGVTVARLGGDEFVVLMRNVEGSTEPLAAAGRLCAALAEPFDHDGKRLLAGGTIGVALWPTHGNDLPALLKAADAAMYAAKSAGRGCARLATGGG